MLITFEGIDGCGKSTLAKTLHDELVRKGCRAKLTKEPTSGPVGKIITEHMGEWDEMTIALLFSTDHSYHVSLVREWLKKGFTVISDRYHGSNLAYQGTSLRDLMKDPMSWLEAISEPFTLPPDITFLLKIDPEIAMGRISRKGKFRDRYEVSAFLEDVQKTYMELAKRRGYVILDGAKTVKENLSKVMEAIEAKGFNNNRL